MFKLLEDEHQDYNYNPDQYHQDAEHSHQSQQHHHNDDVEDGDDDNEMTEEYQRNYNEKKLAQRLNLMPSFDLSVSENITIAENDTATLNCRVHNLGNKSVSALNVNVAKCAYVLYV